MNDDMIRVTQHGFLSEKKGMTVHNLKLAETQYADRVAAAMMSRYDMLTSVDDKIRMLTVKMHRPETQSEFRRLRELFLQEIGSGSAAEKKTPWQRRYDTLLSVLNRQTDAPVSDEEINAILNLLETADSGLIFSVFRKYQPELFSSADVAAVGWLTPEKFGKVFPGLFSYGLRRFVCMRCTGRGKGEVEQPFAVACEDGTVYHFGGVFPEADPSETDAYAVLLAEAEQRLRPEQDAKKRYERKRAFAAYLSGSKLPNRKTLFQLSISLGMSTEEFGSMMQQMDESPWYNSRSPEEMAAKVCHAVPGLRNPDAYDRLLDLAAGGNQKPDGKELLSKNFFSELDAILAEETDPKMVIDRAGAYLRANASRYHGYSQRARELFIEEANDSNELLGFEADRTALWQMDEPQEYQDYDWERNDSSKALLGSRLRNDVYLWSDRMHSGIQSLDDNLLQPPALLKLRQGKVAVTKKSFLQLRIWKLAALYDMTMLEKEELHEVEEEFRRSTDEILMKAGLPPIYAGNAFDILVLTAILSGDPRAYLQMIYRCSEEDADEIANGEAKILTEGE